MNKNHQRVESGNSIFGLIVIFSSIMSCGMLVPIWLLVGLVVMIVQLSCPTPKPAQPKIIFPGNEHAADWQFKFYDVED